MSPSTENAIILSMSFLHRAIDVEAYNLTTTEITQSFYCFVAIITLISLFGVVFLRKQVKRFAWLLSAVNAGVMTLCGIYSLSLFIPKHPNFFLLGGDESLIEGKAVFHNQS